jgi:hypothetical protein
MPSSRFRKGSMDARRRAREALQRVVSKRNRERKDAQVQATRNLGEQAEKLGAERPADAIDEVRQVAQRAEALKPGDRLFAKDADVVDAGLRRLESRFGVRDFRPHLPGRRAPSTEERRTITAEIARRPLLLENPDPNGIVGFLANQERARTAFQRRLQDQTFATLALALFTAERPLPAPAPLEAFADPSVVFPDPLQDTGDSAGGHVVTTRTTAMASGGEGLLTYRWEKAAGVGSPTQPDDQATAFEASNIGPGPAAAGFFTCTVTDGRNTTAKAFVAAFFSNTGAPPEPLNAIARPLVIAGANRGRRVTTEEEVTVEPSGGTPGYSYKWQSATGVGAALNEEGQTTAFRAEGVEPEQTVGDLFTCTVTDATGATAKACVAATFSNKSRKGQNTIR